jgi:tetratricopeptide (TPR) repeat protein
MMKRANSRLWVLVSACGVAVAALAASNTAAAPDRAPEVNPADAQLAEMFADLARRTVLQQRGGANLPSVLQETEALYQAARRLNPTEPRWARYLGDVAVEAGDADTAVDAYKALLALDPSHRGAQVRLIDVYVSRMETADAKVAYLRDLLGKNALPDDVRSVAAVRLANLLLERSQRDQAIPMLEQGLRLNPLNIEGLSLRYRLLQEKGTQLEKTGALLALLRANPLQPDIMWALARSVAQAGLVKDSVRWFDATLAVTQRTGRPLSAGLLSDYASALYVSGDAATAQGLLDRALAGDPNALDLWLVRLAIQKETGNKDFKDSVAKAGVAAFNQLAVVRQQAGIAGATTRPVESADPLTLPDLAADMHAIDGDPTGQLRQAYADVIGDWAWLEVYFAERPDDAQKMIAALRTLLPEGNVVLNRLEGWSYLVKGSADEAKVKLSAAADRDPLSAMGMFRLLSKDPATKDRATSEARRLVSQNPAGLLGAILWGGLKGEGVQFVPGPHAEPIADALRAFPKEILSLIDHPEMFYAIRPEPVKVSHGFAEPMNIRVTLQNLTDYDLTIGPDGMIKPDFIVNARQRGIGDQVFPLVAHDEFRQVTVLKARTGISQLVRLDQGQLGDYLSLRPNASVQLGVDVITNPVVTQQAVFPSAGGYRNQMPRVIERAGANVLSEAGRQKAVAILTGPNSAEKFRTVQLVGAFVRGLRQDPQAQAQEGARKAADGLEQLLANAANDPSESVQAIASFARALVQSDPDARVAALRKMANEKPWQTQLLASFAVQGAPEAIQKPLQSSLAEDARDPLVRKYAAARLETLAALPPTTQTATSQPAAAPVATEPTKP